MVYTWHTQCTICSTTNFCVFLAREREHVATLESKHSPYVKIDRLLYNPSVMLSHTHHLSQTHSLAYVHLYFSFLI